MHVCEVLTKQSQLISLSRQGFRMSFQQGFVEFGSYFLRMHYLGFRMNNVGPCSATYLQMSNLKPLKSMDLLVHLKLDTGLSVAVNQGCAACSAPPGGGADGSGRLCWNYGMVCLEKHL